MTLGAAGRQPQRGSGRLEPTQIRGTAATLLHVHLSGRKLSAKLARAAGPHGERMAQLVEALG